MWTYKGMFNCHCPFIPSVFSVLTTWMCAFSRTDIPLKYTKLKFCVQICILIYLADTSGCAICHFLELRVGIPPGKWMSVVSDVCCMVEISELGRTLVRRSTIESGVSECDGGDSIMMMTWPTRGCCAMERRRMLLVSRTDSKHVRSME
jgi:hypothetical protein